jgi:1-deoxy-D-xylulose-5-phosphate synthase
MVDIAYGGKRNFIERKYQYRSYKCSFCKALDTELFDKMIEKHKLIFTLEDGQKTGGFGSAVLEYINSRNLCVNLQIIGIDDKFIEHGNVKELYMITD